MTILTKEEVRSMERKCMMKDELMKVESLTPQIGDLTVERSLKLLNMFFIVDVSGSMVTDGRIQAVNEAFTKMIPAMREVQMQCRSEFEIRVAILTFDASARWIVEPTPVMDLQFEEIKASNYTTYFSRAFDAFGEKLSRKAFMAWDGQRAVPYIMMMTDGEPTPRDDYQPALERPKENAWFQNAQRFAVLIGRDTVNSPSARKAVAGFVSDEDEGIINAAAACDIAAAVQANTLKQIIAETLHPVKKAVENEETETDSNGGFGDYGGFGSFGGFGGFGSFDDYDDGSDEPPTFGGKYY